MTSSKEEQIKRNQELIRVLNPDAKVQYPVEYASLDNNAAFVVAKAINSLGFDFLNYEDIFKQDFLAEVGYVEHSTINDEEYYWMRGNVKYSKKPFFKLTKDDKSIENISYEEANNYNTEMVSVLYSVIWAYCSKNILHYSAECKNIDQQSLQNLYNNAELYQIDIYSNLLNSLNSEKYLSINSPFVLWAESYSFNSKIYHNNSFTEDFILNNKKNGIFANMYMHQCINELYMYAFEKELKIIFNLFEQLSISLVKDCCTLINQIKMNTAAGRDITYPIYDNSQVLQQPAQQQTTEQPIQLVSVMPGTLGVTDTQPDITQDEINEMAATAEPDLLDELLAEEIMPSFQKNLYAKVGTEYTEMEMDIVRYIVQDMIDAAKAV